MAVTRRRTPGGAGPGPVADDLERALAARKSGFYAEEIAFYAAWAQHNGNSVLSTGDAHGQVISSALILSCSELNTVAALTSVINALSALIPQVCPSSGATP